MKQLISEARTNLFFVILLFSLCFLVSCSQELHHGLTEEQANEILVTLSHNGIRGTKVPEEGGETLTFIIRVPSRDSAKAWQILQQNNLPKPPDKGFGEVFGKTSLIPTATEEKALFLQAVCGELSKTIETISGVVDARVHVVLPESDVLKEELSGPIVPKAAVLIKYKADQSEGLPFRVEDVRLLVANSIEGLKPENVTVVSTEVFPEKQPSFIYAGPLKISSESLLPFQILLGVLVLLFLIVGIMLVMAARSSMSLKKELERLRAASDQSLPQVPK